MHDTISFVEINWLLVFIPFRTDKTNSTTSRGKECNKYSEVLIVGNITGHRCQAPNNDSASDSYVASAPYRIMSHHHTTPHHTTIPCITPHHTTSHHTALIYLPYRITFMACLRATPVCAHSTVIEEGRGLSNIRANDGLTFGISKVWSGCE